MKPKPLRHGRAQQITQSIVDIICKISGFYHNIHTENRIIDISNPLKYLLLNFPLFRKLILAYYSLFRISCLEFDICIPVGCREYHYE